MKKEKCKYCGGPLIFRLRPDTVHYGEMVCIKCGRHNYWVPAPREENTRRRTSKFSLEQVAKFHGMDKPRCFFCLRTKDQLGDHETLTIDHIVELQLGGKDSLENLQILCTACHKLKNWCRLYLNWHFNGKEVNMVNEGGSKQNERRKS